MSKWDPNSPNSPFQTYLYNTVPIEQAPFYGPTAVDNEAKWEEALSKKPSPGAVPVLARGFTNLGERMIMQQQALDLLRGRLHEINEGLNGLLQKHDLEISIRADECRRKHLRLSQRCLGLAAKTQILRNRGYAMDSAEEELRKKLMQLERRVFDPALNGRGEEIWARMVSIRERGRQLQREFERAGTGVVQEGGKGIDEEVMAKTKKVKPRRITCSGTVNTDIATDSGRLQLSAHPSDEGDGADTEGLGGVGGIATQEQQEWRQIATCIVYGYCTRY